MIFYIFWQINVATLSRCVPWCHSSNLSVCVSKYPLVSVRAHLYSHLYSHLYLLLLTHCRYAAGTQPWGTPSVNNTSFEPQRHDDGLLEVIGFTMTALVRCLWLNFTSSLKEILLENGRFLGKKITAVWEKVLTLYFSGFRFSLLTPIFRKLASSCVVTNFPHKN